MKQLSYALSILAICSLAEARAEVKLTHFSTVGKWSIVKEGDGKCAAIASGVESGDYFGIRIERQGVTVSLASSKFRFPVGEYPLGLSIGGTRLFPQFSMTTTGLVRSGRKGAIKITLSPDATQKLLISSWISLDLGGRARMLNVGEIEASLRALSLCERRTSDPFASVR